MEDILVPFIVFAAITAWILGPKWLRMRHEIAKEKINKLTALTPEKEEEVKRLQERVENLETLICRLDSEINVQLEKSLGVGRVVTSTPAAGTSQFPTAFMNVISALEGRYQILKELGRGGMGIVYQAHDKQLNDQVAIKILSPLLINDTEALERMKREVSAARRITHPNVIRIHDIAETGGLHYVSMEYFHGPSLKQFIKSSPSISIPMAANIAYQICDGLDEAHKQGVIHRDLKSQNIIVGQNNHVKIIDFGLAQSAHQQGMTATGLIMGTPEYMSPEQVSGKRVDERADIYSLGIILYELFTGRVPFSGDSAIAVGFKQLKDDPPKPTELNPQLPESIEKVILKALEKDPIRRYSSVSAMKAELEDAVSRPALGKAASQVRKPEEQRIKI